MPYIARRVMKHGDRELGDGDIIEDFEDWPSTNRHYLLEKGDVEYLAASDLPSPPAAAVEPESEGAATSAPAEPPKRSTAKRSSAKRSTATRSSRSSTRAKEAKQ